MRDREPRLASDTRIDVLVGAAVRRSSLVNLSSGGALLGDVRGLPADLLVTICHQDLRVRARVIWCRNGSAGVRFLTPLSREELQGLRDGAPARMAS